RVRWMNQIANRLGKCAKVTVGRIINFVKGNVLDFYSSEVLVLRYDALRLKLLGQIKQEISEFVNNLTNILYEDLGIKLTLADYEYLQSYGTIIADITSGEIFWKLFNYGITLQKMREKRKRVMNAINFFDSVVYNVMLDGLYKIIRSLVFKYLHSLDPHMEVVWVSMNGHFKHPICKKRSEFVLTLDKTEKIFENLYEERYNWLHPHFLCDGIFLPKEVSGMGK
ncbi:MAG: hypothetical protein ABDH59_09620, partial [Fervidobacterium sp.]